MLHRRAMTIRAALEDEVGAARDVHPPERYVSAALARFYNELLEDVVQTLPGLEGSLPDPVTISSLPVSPDASDRARRRARQPHHVFVGLRVRLNQVIALLDAASGPEPRGDPLALLGIRVRATRECLELELAKGSLREGEEVHHSLINAYARLLDDATSLAPQLVAALPPRIKSQFPWGPIQASTHDISELCAFLTALGELVGSAANGWRDDVASHAPARPPSAALQEAIQGWIDASAAREPSASDIRQEFAKRGFLLIHANAAFFWLLSPGGRVYSADQDRLGMPHELEMDPLAVREALVAGSGIHPELTQLLQP